MASSRLSSRNLFAPAAVALLLVASACGKKHAAGSATSAVPAARESREEFSKAGSTLLTALTEPTAPLHFSYKAQTQINNKFPMDAGAKPEVGPETMEADANPDEITIDSTRGAKKEHGSAKKTDQLGWSMIKLNLLGPVGNVSMDLAFAGAVAHKTGSETVGGAEANVYAFDTRTATAEQKAGIAMAQSMLRGRVKVAAIYGTIAVDKTSGRMAKFNFDLEMSETSGRTWKEHHEGEAFAKH